MINLTNTFPQLAFDCTVVVSNRLTSHTLCAHIDSRIALELRDMARKWHTLNRLMQRASYQCFPTVTVVPHSRHCYAVRIAKRPTARSDYHGTIYPLWLYGTVRSPASTQEGDLPLFPRIHIGPSYRRVCIDSTLNNEPTWKCNQICGSQFVQHRPHQSTVSPRAVHNGSGETD